jgi:hypothetical protein
MGTLEARSLIGVDLPGRREPSDPGGRVVVKQQLSGGCDPPRQLERCPIEDQQIDPGRKIDLERLGS